MRIKKAWFGVLVLAMAFGLIAAAACGSEDATPVIIEKEVIVEKEVIKEVPRDVVVEKEVIVEVEKQVIVEKEVIKEVPRDVIVEKEVIREVEVEKTGPVITGVARSGGTLIYGSCSPALSLHPHIKTSYNCEPGPISMYEQLVERDWSATSRERMTATPPAGPIGVLAESWELADDRVTWTFRLRQGVKFQDGTDWNAEVAEINFRSLVDEDYEFFNPLGSANTAFTLSHVDSVRAVDEFTFEMKLNKPFFGFIDKLASNPPFGMVSGNAIQTMTPDEISAGGPWGTGHFQFKEWKRGERLVLERNEDYWGEKAYVDTFFIVPVLDQASRVAALLAGEIDVAADLSPDNLTLVRNVEGIEGYSRGLSVLYALQPNHREPPFSDQRVRRAASLCIDRDELAGTLLQGLYSPGAQIWGPAHPGKDPAGPQITDPYDPELAKELLADAGYPDGFKSKMYSASGAGGFGIPALLVNNYIVISLRECGIDMELVNFDWLTYMGFWSGGIKEDENTGLFTASMGSADIAGYDPYLHSSGWPPSGWSVGWYDNSDVDALIEKAWNATTPEEYLAAEREAHELALEDYAYIPVVGVFYHYGVSDRVGGWTGGSDWIVRFNKAFLEYERE